MSTVSGAVAGTGRETAPGWAVVADRWVRYLTEDLGGGPKVVKIAQMVNFHKVITAFLILGMMKWFDNFSTAAWIYLALHGGYGLVWLIKDLTFPDPSWQRRATVLGGLASFALVLGWYWVFGWLLLARPAAPTYPLPDGAWFCLCIALCLVGCALMLAADAQKYFTLRLRPDLIIDGMFRYVRHPNYLGEMLIYASFALLVQHWLPWLVLAVVWSGLFAVNMAMKEASLARHAEWPAYRARTWWLLPGLL